jgi:hypothetical protein
MRNRASCRNTGNPSRGIARHESCCICGVLSGHSRHGDELDTWFASDEPAVVADAYTVRPSGKKTPCGCNGCASKA